MQRTHSSLSCKASISAGRAAPRCGSSYRPNASAAEKRTAWVSSFSASISMGTAAGAGGLISFKVYAAAMRFARSPDFSIRINAATNRGSPPVQTRFKAVTSRNSA